MRQFILATFVDRDTLVAHVAGVTSAPAYVIYRQLAKTASVVSGHHFTNGEALTPVRSQRGEVGLIFQSEGAKAKELGLLPVPYQDNDLVSFYHNLVYKIVPAAVAATVAAKETARRKKGRRNPRRRSPVHIMCTSKVRRLSATRSATQRTIFRRA